MTRGNGATAWQVRYRAYGNVWREEIADVATPLRFQGQYFDAETGLHYNRHRYYQPETGRFITPDPIGLAGGLNNYQYAPNPTGWVDPLGLKNVKENGLNNIDGKASPSLQGGPEEPPSVSSNRRRELNDKFGRTGNIHADINQRQRKQVAFDFYKNSGYKTDDIPSHLNGIDFTQDVKIETLNKGKILYQFQSPGARQGSYYSPNANVTPSELGIGSLGKSWISGTVELKIKNKYVTKEKVQVLRSKAKEMDDFWSTPGTTQPSKGGGTQMFSSEINSFGPKE